tara:strand:+ start:1804 stop:3063 length:1260 start_codon:yes stop_codon:yes gene_type:complete
MASLTGLSSGNFTDIDVLDTININGNSGTAGQVLTSDGTLTDYADVTAPPAADIVGAGTGITITSTGNPEDIATNVKSLVLSGTAVTSSPQTFNPNANGGSQTITISDTNTEYSAGDGIDISGGNAISADLKSGSGLVITSGEIDLEDIPNSNLAENTISGIALGSDLANLTIGDGLLLVDSGASEQTTYNGSSLRALSVQLNGSTLTNSATGLSLTNSTISGIALGSNLANLTGGTGISMSTYNGATARAIALADTIPLLPAGVYDVGSGVYHMPFDAGIFHPNPDDTSANYAIMDTGAKTLGRGVIKGTKLEVSGFLRIPNGWSATGSFLDVRDSSGAVITSSPPTYDIWRVFTHQAGGTIPSAIQLNSSGQAINTSNAFYGSVSVASSAVESLMIDINVGSLTHYIGGGYIILTAP